MRPTTRRRRARSTACVRRSRNRILLEHYYLRGALDEAIAVFVEQFNHHLYHESLGYLTPADVCFGRAQTILSQQKEIKARKIVTRRLLHRQTGA